MGAVTTNASSLPPVTKATQKHYADSPVRVVARLPGPSVVIEAHRSRERSRKQDLIVAKMVVPGARDNTHTDGRTRPIQQPSVSAAHGPHTGLQLLQSSEVVSDSYTGRP